MKKAITLGILLIFSIVGYAQIKHTNISPVRVLDGSKSANKLDSVKMHLAHPLTAAIGSDSALHIWHFDAPPTFSNDVGIDCRGNDVEILKLTTSNVPFQFAAIDSGVMINATAGTWDRPNYDRLALENATDNWDNVTDKYVGVRFKRNSKWHYGWIKMSIDALPTKAEIKGYAYETTSEKGIIAGNKGSSTSSVILFEKSELKVRYWNRRITFPVTSTSYPARIIGASGTVVFKGLINNSNRFIDASGFPEGIYIVEVIIDNTPSYTKLSVY